MATERSLPTTVPRAGPRARSAFSMRRRRQLEVSLIRVILIVITAVTLLPTVYVVLFSLKAGSAALYSATLIPKSLTLGNYSQLLQTDFLRWVGNSLLIGGISGVLQVIFATFAGYAFARMRFRGRRYGILALLIIQMLPANMALVAYFYLFNLSHLYNTRTALILLFGFGGSALAVWLMKNFIESIPKDLDEAAYLDGAGYWRTFWDIVFPLAQPMLVAQFIFGFIGIYNEYIVTTIILSDPKKYPLGVGVLTFSQQYNTNWTEFCAAAVLGSIPILVIFFLAQRLFVEGLTKGAIKG